MPDALLKITTSWLSDRQAHISFGERRSDNFDVRIGLPQASSLSLYLFIVYHCDLIQSRGVHPSHLFADDLCVLIRALYMKSLPRILDYM